MTKRPWLYVLGAVVLILAVGVGALGGAAATYFVTRPDPVEAAIGLTQATDTANDGLLIAAVADDSPAAEAGLVRGDILLALDGTEIDTFADLQRLLAELESGDAVRLTVRHGDETRDLEAMLGDREGRAYLGVRPCDCGLSGPRFRDGEPGEGLRQMPFRGAMMVGARVTEVVDGSPADEAGLIAGDVIVAVDGEDLDPGRNLAALIQVNVPGDTVTLSVIAAEDVPPLDELQIVPREDEDGDMTVVTPWDDLPTEEVTVTLGENPDQEGQAYLGIRYAPASPMREFRWEGMPEGFDPRRFFRGMPGLPGLELPEGVERAAFIGEVAPDSPAEEAGLQRGDIVLALDGEPLDGPRALVAAVGEREPGDAVTLTLYRDGEETDVTVTLGENPDEEEQAYLGVTVTGFIRMQRRGRPGSGPFNFDFDLDEFDLPTPGRQDA